MGSSHLSAWVPRCYLIKASLLDGPLSKLIYFNLVEEEDAELNQIQAVWR